MANHPTRIVTCFAVGLYLAASAASVAAQSMPDTATTQGPTTACANDLHWDHYYIAKHQRGEEYDFPGGRQCVQIQENRTLALTGETKEVWPEGDLIIEVHDGSMTRWVRDEDLGLARSSQQSSQAESGEGVLLTERRTVLCRDWEGIEERERETQAGNHAAGMPPDEPECTRVWPDTELVGPLEERTTEPLESPFYQVRYDGQLWWVLTYSVTEQ